MLKLNYSTVLAQIRTMETFKLKICHYLDCESHIYLVCWVKKDASQSCYMLRLVHMNLSGASEPTVAYKEPLFVDEH